MRFRQIQNYRSTNCESGSWTYSAFGQYDRDVMQNKRTTKASRNQMDQKWKASGLCEWENAGQSNSFLAKHFWFKTPVFRSTKFLDRMGSSLSWQSGISKNQTSESTIAHRTTDWELTEKELFCGREAFSTTSVRITAFLCHFSLIFSPSRRRSRSIGATSGRSLGLPSLLLLLLLPVQ